MKCSVSLWNVKCTYLQILPNYLHSTALKTTTWMKLDINSPVWCKPLLCHCTTLRISCCHLWRSLWCPQRSSGQRQKSKGGPWGPQVKMKGSSNRSAWKRMWIPAHARGFHYDAGRKTSMRYSERWMLWTKEPSSGCSRYDRRKMT